MRLENPFKISDFMSGMISDVSETIAPLNSVALLLNMDCDVILGAIVSRLGLSQIGAQLVAGKSILGLHQYIDGVTPANNLLFAVVNAVGDATSTIKNVVTGANVVTGLTPSLKTRFLTYGGETLAINGTDAERAWNGSAWITAGGVFDLTDFPGANKCNLVIEFLDRVYAGGDTANPSRVYYSDIVTAGVIAWIGDYVDIESENQNGKLTAFAKVPGYVLFFKERSMNRWNYSSAFPESLVTIGTPSQECVAQSGGLVFFYSNSDEDARGFYVTNGGRPQCISKDASRTIRRFIDAIPSANESAIATSATDRVIQWSVGDITVDGETFTNVVFKYNRILNQWSMRTYPNEFKVFASYLVSGVNVQVGGDDDGNVWRLDTPATYKDGTTDILWKVRTHSNSFGTNLLKEISGEIVVRGKNLDGMESYFLPDEDVSKQIKNESPRWYRKILSLIKIGEKLSATSLAIEVRGVSTGAQVVLKEIEVPNIDIKLNYES